MSRPRSAPGRRARLLHDAFEIGVTVKAAFAAAETLAGIGLFFVHAGWVKAAARWLVAGELAEDPNDWLSGRIMAAAQAYSISTQHFWAAYLLGHGAIKLCAVAALLARVRWAYPLSMLILAGFIVWQMQKWFVSHAPLMLGLSVFDVLVIWLIWHEYRTMAARA
ncbi:DUF2127 domain-containing protein [Albidovulum sp.]|uniref:DUF2127 domain-containing protein n=1 Tax=Albidovulum sp. TaxID=1872424 RepID=UPI0039B9220B